MKKALWLLPCCFLFMLANSCKKESAKDVNVRISEIKQVHEDKVEVTIGFEKGAASFEEIGFCYAGHSKPTLNDHSALFSSNGGYGDYSEYIGDLKADSTYYFCSYLRMDGKVVYGEVIPFSMPAVVLPPTPCSLNSNEMITDGKTYVAEKAVKTTSTNYGEYKIELNLSSVGGPGFILYFDSPPVNTVYTTVRLGHFAQWKPKPDHNWRKTLVRVHGKQNDYDMEPGGSVYINKNADGTYKVEFCDLNYKIGSSTTVLSKGSFLTH